MKTHIAHTSTTSELAHAVESAVYLLSGGFPVALPTETVYGLAGWALHRDPLFRIFSTKERPQFDPLIIHIPTLEWLDNLCVLPREDRALVDRLTAAFWPGPLTLVLPRKPVVPDLACSGLPTVALRMSGHRVFKEVIEAFGQPLAAPSANRFGRVSPTTAQHVMDELSGRIHLIVDSGPTQHGVESTIVTVRGDSLWILRNGPITAEELSRHAKVSVASMPGKPMAPGQLKSHYAPSTPLHLIAPGENPPETRNPNGLGLLAFCAQEQPPAYKHMEVLSRQGDLREAAANLFAKLRALDSKGLAAIYAETVPETGLGAAIMDRLRKAAAAHG
jgi:L-threonylcarbamoyladenylate synthase